MPANFTIHGPFVIPTKNRKLRGGKLSIRQLDVNANLWKKQPFLDFADKKGCYVYANATGRGSTPIYVGLTNCSFKQECFSPTKKSLLNDFLANKGKTGPQIYFIVLNARKDCSEEIDLCETFLIQKCKEANENLLNVKKLAAKFTIKSFHRNTSRANHDVTEFKKCLNLNQMRVK